MVEAIQDYIGSLNWGYRIALRDKKVNYLNAYAELTDAHTIKVCTSLEFLTVNLLGMFTKQRINTSYIGFYAF